MAPETYMTTGTTEQVLDDRVRQIITQHDLCVASGIGPDGLIDGILVFGLSGSVELTDTGLCRFPLRAIEEGSPLRTWLRISRHTDVSVPWALMFLDRASGALVRLVGAARLVAGSDVPFPERTNSLTVELTPTRVTHQPGDPRSSDAPLPAATTTAATKDGSLRAMAEQPTKELSEPVRAFLTTAAEAFLCRSDGDGHPLIHHLEAASNGAMTPKPEFSVGEQSVYVRADAIASGSSEAGNESKVGALLIVPSFAARLAVRVAGESRTVDVADTPLSIQTALQGTDFAWEIAVTLVGVQAGDWSGTKEPTDQSGNMRVSESVLRVHGARSIGRAEVSFAGGPTVLVQGGESLLELAEANGIPMEAGCRMGICGADPVRIDAGAENLSRIRRSEQSTLDRLGLPPSCRMACSARVQGSVTVASVDEASALQSTSSGSSLTTADFALDPEVRRVVVIGTGIAGITAAEEVRKLHPDVDITVAGAERYDFYNRMAISRLVDEDTTADKLSLMSSDWARRRKVVYLPGLSIRAIDRSRREAIPAEGVSLLYDRLVLAMGARSRILPIEGLDLPGAFALRTIDDALEIHRHVRQTGVRRAIVVGGGLLGLEAAYHLVQAGLRVWIVGRGEWPADRQLDEHAGGILSQMLQDLGIEYIPHSEPRRVVGHEAVEGVELMDGRVLPAALCLVAAGIVPNVGLARDAGLEVAQGVVVDDHMRTSDPSIYAAGDVIEFRGRSFGLWPASVDQALVAATNLLGGDLRYHATMAPAQLKVPGIDLLSVGEIRPREPGDQEIRIADRHARRYRKLVVRDGHAIGAIVIGSAALFDGTAEAVQANLDLSDRLDDIERGDWSALTSDDNEAEVTAPTVSRVG
jgi:NADPH-dependent 2,4-dienoyl-CoA reductase/sulfur reductase-like enzyme/ferredoxin